MEESEKNRKLPTWMKQGNATSTNDIKTSSKISLKKRKIEKIDRSIKRTIYCMTPGELIEHAKSIVKQEAEIGVKVQKSETPSTPISKNSHDNVIDSKKMTGRIGDNLANTQYMTESEQCETKDEISHHSIFEKQYTSIIDELM